MVSLRVPTPDREPLALILSAPAAFHETLLSQFLVRSDEPVGRLQVFRLRIQCGSKRVGCLLVFPQGKQSPSQEQLNRTSELNLSLNFLCTSRIATKSADFFVRFAGSAGSRLVQGVNVRRQGLEMPICNFVLFGGPIKDP